jgi:hypothetical protein
MGRSAVYNTYRQAILRQVCARGTGPASRGAGRREARQAGGKGGGKCSGRPAVAREGRTVPEHSRQDHENGAGVAGVLAAKVHVVVQRNRASVREANQLALVAHAIPEQPEHVLASADPSSKQQRLQTKAVSHARAKEKGGSGCSVTLGRCAGMRALGRC